MIVAAAHAKGALAVMDNTWATPLLFRPLSHGIDIVIYAATKYLVGHGGKQTAVAAALPDGARDRALVHELGLPKPE